MDKVEIDAKESRLDSQAQAFAPMHSSFTRGAFIDIFGVYHRLEALPRYIKLAEGLLSSAIRAPRSGGFS